MWLYGMLSFPFCVFAIPVISNIFVSTKATAYDSDCNTVPDQGKMEMIYEEEEETDFMDEIEKIDLE